MTNATKREYETRRDNAQFFGWFDYLRPEDVNELRRDVKARSKEGSARMLPDSNYRASYRTTAEGEIILTSYYTDVAKINADGELVRLWDGWSATTARHISKFCHLFNMKDPNKFDWIMSDVGTPIKYSRG